MNNDIFNKEFNNDFNINDDNQEYENNVVAKHSFSQLFNQNKPRIIVGIIFFVIVLCAISCLVFVNSRQTDSYDLESKSITIVDMGSSQDISLNLKKINRNGKYLSNVKTTFNTDNDYVVAFTQDEVMGSTPVTKIIPTQEGIANIYIDAFKDSKILKSEKRTIVVCPEFNKSLLNSDLISVKKGTNYDLNLNFGEKVCSEEINYQSSDSNIFTVDNQGSISAINEGKANLLIIKKRNIISVPVNVVKNNINISSINTSLKKLQLIPGESVRLGINYAPSSATNVSITATSSNTEIAIVNIGNVITAIKPGTATIEFSSGLIKTRVEVIVEDINKEQSLAEDILLEESAFHLNVGQSKKIQSIVKPDSALNGKVIWYSADEDIVSVVAGAVIYAKKPGNTNITVINGDIVKDIPVAVN